MRHLLLLISTLTITLPGMPLVAQEFSSGDKPIPLLELYTSEGCNSCPPADRWFTALKDDRGLWREYIPVAFHVDYWNYLGWEDRFANPSFAVRQRNYQRQGYSRGVYTPGVMLGGSEWRSWRRTNTPRVATADPVGDLQLRVDGDGFTASFRPTQASVREDLRLHVAVLGTGLKSQVRAGENRGKELRHDFVVLGHRVYTGSAATSDAMASAWSGRLPTLSVKGTDDTADRLAVAAWLSDGDDVTPLQAVGGWLAAR